MKKLFTLLSLMLFALILGVNAQDRKTWDFTKGVSDESRALLDGATTLFDRTGDPSTAWTSTVCPDGEIKVGDQVIKEYAGLLFTDFESSKGLNALMLKTNCIRLSKQSKVTLPALKAGQKIEIKAQSANKDATDRGFAFSNASIDDEALANGIVLGNAAAGAPEGGVTVFHLTVEADGVVAISTGMTGTPKAGVEILSIIIDEGDKNIKKWDFSAWSAATKAQVCGAEDWTKSESATKTYIEGDEIRWINAAKFDANDDLTAGGEAIAELKGLRHTGLGQYGLALAFDYQTTTDGNNWGPYDKGSYLWVMTTTSTIVVPKVKLGSTFKVVSESHKLSEARGFNVSVNGTGLTSASGTSTSTAITEFVYTIPADAVDEDEDGYVDVTLKATKGLHLYSIEAEVKDESIVDKNPRLGKPELSIKEGSSVNASKTKGFVMTFPKMQNILDAANVTVEIEGYYTKDGKVVDEFDGGGDLLNGVVVNDVLSLKQESNYELCITSIIIGEPYAALSQEGTEEAPVLTVKFATAAPAITKVREWSFSTDDDIAAAMKQSYDNGENIWNGPADSNGRYSVLNPISTPSELILMKDEEVGNIKFPITEGLLFTMSTAKDILFGSPANSKYNRMQLGGSTPRITIPSCSVGDEITIEMQYASSSGSSITITGGVLKDDETKNSIAPVAKDKTSYTFKVTQEGDVVLACKSIAMWTMKVIPASELEGEVTVNVVAKAGEEVLKTYVENKTVKKNTAVDVSYSYYLKGSDDLLYTAGSKGSTFSKTFTPLEGGDLVIEYNKKEITGLKKVVYCSEAEDIENASLCESGNIPARSSNCKAAYALADLTLCTLPAGTYAMKVITFDPTKNGGTTVLKFTVGTTELPITSNAENMGEQDTPSFTLTEAADVVWKESGDTTHGLDAIVIYEIDEATGITEAPTTATVVKANKYLENGKIVIKKAGKKYSISAIELK